jgi:hypothetical protein
MKVADYGYSELAAMLKQIGRNWNFNMFLVEECSKIPIIVSGLYVKEAY